MASDDAVDGDEDLGPVRVAADPDAARVIVDPVLVA